MSMYDPVRRTFHETAQLGSDYQHHVTSLQLHIAPTTHAVHCSPHCLGKDKVSSSTEKNADSILCLIGSWLLSQMVKGLAACLGFGN
jgi:hypothetical protein